MVSLEEAIAIRVKRQADKDRFEAEVAERERIIREIREFIAERVESKEGWKVEQGKLFVVGDNSDTYTVRFSYGLHDYAMLGEVRRTEGKISLSHPIPIRWYAPNGCLYMTLISAIMSTVNTKNL